MIKIEGVCQFSSRIAPQWNSQTAPETSLAPAKYRDEGRAELRRFTCQLWSRQRGCRWSPRRHRQHRLRCWPAGTWCWRTPPPPRHTSSLRGRRQRPNIWEKTGFHLKLLGYISTHLPLYWDILKLFSVPFSIPLISSTGAKPYEKIIIRNLIRLDCGHSKTITASPSPLSSVY